MGLSRQEHWSGLPCPPPGRLPTQGSNPGLLHWQTSSLALVPLSILRDAGYHCSAAGFSDVPGPVVRTVRTIRSDAGGDSDGMSTTPLCPDHRLSYITGGEVLCQAFLVRDFRLAPGEGATLPRHWDGKSRSPRGEYVDDCGSPDPGSRGHRPWRVCGQSGSPELVPHSDP